MSFSKQVSRTNTAPWSHQAAYLSNIGPGGPTGIYQEAERLYGEANKDPYGGSLYAAPNATQQQALQGRINYANALGDPGAGTRDLAERTIRGDFLHPESNPYLQGNIEAAIRPVQDAYTRQILPGISSAAQQQGAYGGSRHGVAQGVAAGDFARNAGDISAQLVAQNYGQERMLQQNAPQLLAQGLQLGALPQDLLGEAGAQQQQWDQAALNEAYQRWQMEQQAPWSPLERYAAFIQAGSPGSSVSFSPGGGGIGQALGQGLQGGIGGALLGGLGAQYLGYSPAIGAGIGGGLGFGGGFGGAF